MANTNSTNKARMSRVLNKRRLASHNENNPAEIDKVRHEVSALGNSGERYGNHRKMKASEKVTDRRHERRVLNRNVDSE